MKKILLIATYDSFLNTGLEIAKSIDNAIIEVKIRISIKNQLSQNQLSNIFQKDTIKYSKFYLNNYKDIDFNQYDIIILSAGNSFHQSFFEFYLMNEKIDRDNIVTITLFPGVIFGEINSIISRINSDIILCNNQMDFNIIHKIKNQWSYDTQVLLYGFPSIKKIEIINRKNIYFFEQVKIPEIYLDRMYLIIKLVELAQNNPKETIYIKSRVALDEKTIHPNKYPLETLLQEYNKTNDVPRNLLFTYEDVSYCLSNAKSVATISSTVAFESIYNNIPTYIISDFGLRKEFANYDFLDSGCLFKFNEINKITPLINKEWYDLMILFPEERIKILNKSINFLIKKTKKKNILCTQDDNYIDFLQKNIVKKNTLIEKIKKKLYKKLKVFI